ncbi:hypothetical protein SUGI_0144250 [Cryptomeria japonica]|nr:hypothetical protein SUGI_0144250 [Cryptomeria japonica]
MMPPGEALENGAISGEGRMLKRNQRYGSAVYGYTPLQVIHILGRFMRLWSVYATYQYLSQTGVSVIVFMFICILSSTMIFLVLQKPWKGRPLSTSQVVPSVINGGITALYFLLWGKGLESCGPVRAVLAEYAGAVLGVLSAFLYGRGGQIWKKEAVAFWETPEPYKGTPKGDVASEEEFNTVKTAHHWMKGKNAALGVNELGATIQKGVTTPISTALPREEWQRG